MLRALLYLRLTSLQNRLLTQARRLKQPKYLVGAVAFVGYMWFFVFRGFTRNLGGGSRRATAAQTANWAHTLAALPTPDDTLALALGLGSLALLVIVLLAWLLPSERPGLAFSEAEVAFLFPAPVSRRQLVNFTLAGAQVKLLFTAVVFALLSNRWSFLGGNTLTHAIGWWVILATLRLHLTASALTITRLVDNGVSPLRRRLAVTGGIALVVVATLAWIWRDLHAPAEADLASLRSAAHWLVGVLDRGLVWWLLAPCRFVLGPFLAADGRAFIFALGPALLVMAAHYVWTQGIEASFEEASIARAEKLGARVAAVRSGKSTFAAARTKSRPGPFRLAGTGRPELAFLWKNLLGTWSWLSARTFFILAAGIVAGATWAGRHPAWHPVLNGLGAGALICAAYTLLGGPQFARQDIRSDLPNTDILKTYPLPGWQLLLGEMLAPIAILTGVLWLELLTAALALHPSGKNFTWLTPSLHVTLTVALALLVPAIATLQLTVPNAAAVLFPAWFTATRQRGAGFDVAGQRMIFGLGQTLVMLLALVPAVIVASCLVLGAAWLGLPPAAGVLIAAALVCVVLAGEVAVALYFLGQRFEQIDLSAELRA